ncbi:MAG: hypothetical protein WBP10_12170 [Thermoanaerobaculia bacterium]
MSSLKPFGGAQSEHPPDQRQVDTIIGKGSIQIRFDPGGWRVSET